MRPLLLTIIAALSVLLVAGSALAHHKPSHPGGPDSDVHDNRGTVKIHEGAGEPSPMMRNQPQVCEFHVHMFKFHADQELEISIVGQGGDNVAGPDTYTATVTTDANGEAREPSTGSITLADGNYKLTVDTGKGAGKHKVFKIDCPETPDQPIGGGGDEGGPPAGGGGDEGGPTPGGGNEGGPTPGGGNEGGPRPGGEPGIIPGGAGEEGPANPPKPGLLPDTAVEAITDALPLSAAVVLLLTALGGFAFAARKGAAISR